ncbi:hypothetical protein BU15DRAFT_63878 [Melanogaster broomeanus]|nr:hypothetical protein BU15DRAFT_63878 [Melanogaster broomeanus]
MLIIDFEPGDPENAQNQWNIPATLRPLSQSLAEQDQVIYDIVGITYFGPAVRHFVARYVVGEKKLIFDYDGLRHGGTAFAIRGATISTHLTGHPNAKNCPSGYVHHSIVYRLRGGTNAQEVFAKYQKEQASRLHNVTFESSDSHHSFPTISLQKVNVTRLLPEDLRWLKRPSKAKTTDYDKVQVLTGHASTQQTSSGSNLPHVRGVAVPATLGRRLNLLATPVIHQELGQSKHGLLDVTEQERVPWLDVEGTGIQSDLSSSMPHCRADLVDELWNERDHRRQIRLGYWVHAWDVPIDEDILLRFQEVSYPVNIHEMLSRYIPELQALLENPAPDAHPHLPVTQYLLRKGQPPDSSGSYPIKYCGDLTLVECAQITKWFFDHVPGAQGTVHMWLGSVPLAHALTLVIAQRQLSPMLHLQEGEELTTTLQAAWEYLINQTGKAREAIDVNRECLLAFEERLFEDSLAAGIAGNQQWGLDAGEHQDHWHPYWGMPSQWNVEDREYSEGELNRGPEFSTGSEKEIEDTPITQEMSRKRPRPRPKVCSVPVRMVKPRLV